MTKKIEHLKNIDKIVSEAQEAFWAKVVELVPEADSGDLSPHTSIAKDEADMVAVKEWIENNVVDKFSKVVQLKVDIAYNDESEVESFYNSIKNINENSEFDLDVMDDGNAPYTEDMTEDYKKMGCSNIE